MPASKPRTRREQVSEAYRALFDGKHPMGNLVLEDLARQAQFYVAQNDVTTELLQWLEGRRSLFLHILHEGRKGRSLAEVIQITNWNPGEEEKQA